MTARAHAFQRNRPSALARNAFLDLFGGVYEHSQWIAATAFDRGLDENYDTAEALAAEMVDVIALAGREPQLSLLRAHPDLAGKLALAGDLTAESTNEQAGAGLDQCSQEEFAEFQKLNERYKVQFGFPFILAVRGRGRAEILDNFRARVDNDEDEEFAEALAQVHRIAYSRLRQID